MISRTVGTVLTVLGCAAVIAAAPPQITPLPMGEPASASVSSGGTVDFSFDADGAGLLTVSIYTRGDADLYIELADAAGQSLDTTDSNLNGHMGSEVLAAPIRVAGSYRIRVRGRGAADFTILGAWLPTPGLEVAADPDGAPTEATRLAVGEPHSDRIDPESGDPWDWFSLTVPDGGLVSVLVEAPEGDLALELYRADHFDEAAERSDQDLEGVQGNEAITTRAEAGETLYFKVTPVFGGSAIEYTIRVGVM